jgi:hypothetical protein
MATRLHTSLRTVARATSAAALVAALIAGGFSSSALAGHRYRRACTTAAFTTRTAPRFVRVNSYPVYTTRTAYIAGRTRRVGVPYARTTFADPYCSTTRVRRVPYSTRRYATYTYPTRVYSTYSGLRAYNSYSPYAYYPSYSYGAYPVDARYYSERRGDLSRGEVARRASRQGYFDGFRRGQYDRSIGTRVPKPTGHGAYQNAFNGFDPDWGYALTYRQAYRQGFINGYAAGFGRRVVAARYGYGY